jgi:hypothetical protein
MDRATASFLVTTINEAVDNSRQQIDEHKDLTDHVKVTRLLENIGTLYGELIYIRDVIESDLDKPAKKFWQFWK